MRERELKPCSYHDQKGNVTSLPMRERELKLTGLH